MTRKDKKLVAKQLLNCRGALAHLATKDEDAKRRFADEDDDAWLFPFEGPYQMDLEKGLDSKGIRRLEKTQVILDPKNAHARNRMVHTDEVMSTAAKGARILGLNVPLVLAGALLHDIGHSPLGHQGERFLGKVHPDAFFRHEVFGCILVQRIERLATGLNLTKQTLQVIRYHSRGEHAPKASGISQEADMVMFADKISYIFADFSDIFSREASYESHLAIGDFPGLSEKVNWFGNNQRERVETALTALCLESADKGAVSFSGSEAAQRFAELKKQMYEVYPRVYPRNNFPVLKFLYDSLAEAVPDVNTTVLFALMEDVDIQRLLRLVYGGQVLRRDSLDGTAVADAMPYIRNQKFDLHDPDIDW